MTIMEQFQKMANSGTVNFFEVVKNYKIFFYSKKSFMYLPFFYDKNWLLYKNLKLAEKISSSRNFCAHLGGLARA